jgi:hypothetical protein
LELANEAGEVAGKVKKIFRDRQEVITDTDRRNLYVRTSRRTTHAVQRPAMLVAAVRRSG